MAIVDMTRFSLMTFARDKEVLLKELQKFDYVHLLKTEEPERAEEETEAKIGKAPETVVAVNQEVEKVRYALKLLYNYDQRPGGIKGLQAGNPVVAFDDLEDKVQASNWEETYEKVREISDRLDALKVRETKIRSDLEEVTTWTSLDISPKRIESIHSVHGMVGSIPRKMEEQLVREMRALKLTYLEKVGENKADFYYLILSHPSEEEPLQEILRQVAFTQVRLDYDEVPLARKQRLNKEIIELKAEENRTREELGDYGKDIPKLELAYEYLSNKQIRITADENFLSTDYMIFTEGYIPSKEIPQFEETLKKAVGDGYYLTTEPAERDNPEVPVITKNNPFVSAFEDVTSMYAMPHYNEIDPTPFLAPFYMFFFGMMLADAGYGLLLLIGTTVMLKKFNLKKGMKQFVRFFHYLSYTTIVWGLIFGSFLGLSLPFGLLDTGTDFMPMLILSLIFGVIHLFFGLGIKAYMSIRDNNPGGVVDVLFWYAALIGLAGLLLSGPLGLPPLVGEISKWMTIGGMAGIVLFSARENKNWGVRVGVGLYNLYGVSSWVGDIVSYSRLMALALSGAFIAMAFNMIAEMVGGAWYTLPISVIIFLVGIVFNMFLSALSAYVHSLRLTYVEFFGKFYEGGGVRFRKLKKEPEYVTYAEEDRY